MLDAIEPAPNPNLNREIYNLSSPIPNPKFLKCLKLLLPSSELMVSRAPAPSIGTKRDHKSEIPNPQFV